ncbi:MAG: hypothetical protein QM790_18390 [Nibricoccus sp.]
MKYLKAIIVLLLVFSAGISVGVVATRTIIKRDIRRAVLQPELVRLRVERELTRELTLSPEQQTKLDGILVKFQQDIAKARKEKNFRIRPFFADATRQINEMLTPEQLEKFERYQAENGVFSFGSAQGQNYPRLQKLRKLRDNMQRQNSSPAPSPSAPSSSATSSSSTEPTSE